LPILGIFGQGFGTTAVQSDKYPLVKVFAGILHHEDDLYSGATTNTAGKKKAHRSAPQTPKKIFQKPINQ